LSALGFALAAFGCSEPVEQQSAEPDSSVMQPGPAQAPARDAPGVKPRSRLFPGPKRARRSRVTDVSDGDTITLSGVGRVRLIGADTPEVFGGAECFGRRASGFTKRVLTPGRRVRFRLGIESRDRYGRALAYVWLRDGRMFNGLLVQRGFALPLAIAPNIEYARRFRIAARRARRSRLGLWGARGCARDAAGSRRNGGQRGGAADRDCSDFATQAAAQRYFERRGGKPGRDVDQLDAEGDGRVCEALP